MEIRETCQNDHHTDTQEQAKHPENIEKNSIPIEILCGSQQTVENFSRVGDTRPPYQPRKKCVCRSRSNS